MSDQLSYHPYSRPFLIYWETFMHLGTFITTALTLTKIRLKHFAEQGISRQLQSTVVELQKTQTRMAELMTLDMLTGIANRSSGVRQITVEINRATRNRNPFALLLFNVENFRHYNKIAGHDAGDELLVELARLLQRQLRPMDTVCRYAGDQFLIIAPGADHDGAKCIFNRIRHEVVGTVELLSGVNCHIVQFVAGESADQLLLRLEQAA
jgi:diguanylate cyclase (GGDEF)-like protein